MSNWHVFRGVAKPHNAMESFVVAHPPPPWRRFAGAVNAAGDGDKLQADPDLVKRFQAGRFLVSGPELDSINAAVYLRRPLLVTGKPGTGKTTLAYALAHELKLGKVLTWPITSRATLTDALYRYDAIGRLHEANLARRETEGGGNGQTAQQAQPVQQNIGKFIRLGPVGTALLPRRYPRVLLIDEIDKSDVDLPNDLLHVLETGAYEIPELTRLSKEQPDVWVNPADSDEPVLIHEGRVACAAFPIVVLTSNGEREFPPAFLRRCVRLQIPDPTREKLADILTAYFGKDSERAGQRDALIDAFLKRRDQGDLSTDQLLNAIFLARQGDGDFATPEELAALLFQQLSGVTA